ncbi:MAG: HD domain-containing protein [Endomicrobium sp.]|nr:HD domain-containing protein [Endomicrobium sp.]
MRNIIKKINSLSQGFDVYAVGGFARDLLMERKHKDIDLVVNKNALKYSKQIANAFNSKLVVLDDESKSYRIILKDKVIPNIDISLFRGKTIEQDLQDRDFTINAMAFSLKSFENFRQNIILSQKDTVKDLKSKIINTISPKSFKTDPLRMLRAFRFAAELNFKLSKKTLLQIKQNVKLISGIAVERIKNEIFAVLSAKNSVNLVDEMDKCGLLSKIFPLIKEMKKSRKKYYYHPGGLFQHSFETMEAIENILNNLQKFFPINCIELQEHFNDSNAFSENVTKMGLLKFAALFHDNAKPETAKFENGKIHFLEHDKLGSEKIRKTMLSLKLGKKDVDYVTFLVEHHMRPSVLTSENMVTKRASLKFFRDIGDKTPDLFIVSMADWYSYKKLKISSSKRLKFQEKYVKNLLKYYYELKNTKPLPKIIDGNMIMEKFNLNPGPLVGELLKIATEAQHEGTVTDSAEALKLISSKLTQMGKKI